MAMRSGERQAGMKSSRAADSGPAPDATLDVRGLACPLPVLKARKALLAMPSGRRLLVLATDPVSAIDIPHLCKESGHRLIASDTAGTPLRFLIERT
jgi:tRNA 2-thiouridine synthesizing protein A